MPSRWRRLMKEYGTESMQEASRLAGSDIVTRSVEADELDEPSPYTCEDCGKEFESNRGLNMHITKVHGEGESDD